MSLTYLPLILIQPARNDGSRPEFPRLPPNMSRELEEGSRSLSVGLLVGEKLGLDVSKLSECLNAVWFAPVHRGKGLFMEEDVDILLEGYSRVRDALSAALDDRGRPRGAAGERLRSSSGIEQRPDGELLTRSRQVRLIDLLAQLNELIPFLTFARAQNLYVSEGELPSIEEIRQSMREQVHKGEGRDEDVS